MTIYWTSFIIHWKKQLYYTILLYQPKMARNKLFFYIIIFFHFSYFFLPFYFFEFFYFEFFPFFHIWDFFKTSFLFRLKFFRFIWRKLEMRYTYKNFFTCKRAFILSKPFWKIQIRGLPEPWKFCKQSLVFFIKK